MDLRHQRLHPAVQYLRKTGVLGYLLHRHTSLAQHFGRAAGGQDLHAACPQRLCERHQTCLVGNRDQRATDRDNVGHARGIALQSQQVQRTGHHLCFVVTLHRALAARRAHARPKRLVSHQPLQCRGKRGRIAGRHQQAGHLRHHLLRRAAHIWWRPPAARSALPRSPTWAGPRTGWAARRYPPPPSGPPRPRGSPAAEAARPGRRPAAAPPCPDRDPRSAARPTTHSAASGTIAHRGGQLRIALVPDQPRHREHHHLLVRHAQRGADPSAGRWIGPEARRVAAIADGDGAAMDAQPPGIAAPRPR